MARKSLLGWLRGAFFKTIEIRIRHLDRDSVKKLLCFLSGKKGFVAARNLPFIVAAKAKINAILIIFFSCSRDQLGALDSV